MASLHRRRLARAVSSLAARDTSALGLDPALAARAARAARRDADTAFTAAVAAAGGSPGRNGHRDLAGALDAAQTALNAATAQSHPGLHARAHALAAVAITPAAKHKARARLAAILAMPRMPTLHLPSLTGIWGAIYQRRGRMLDQHAKAVGAAWDACVAELDTAGLVREYRKTLKAEGLDA